MWNSEANSNRGYGRGYGGGGRGGGGRGRGRGGGRGGGNMRFALGSVQLAFLGFDRARLSPYDGPFEDARLSAFQTYALLPVAEQTAHHGAAMAALDETQYKQVLPDLLADDVRWKAQFGTQIIYFGCAGGLDRGLENSLTSGTLSSAEVLNALNGPKRSSFASVSYSSIQSVVRALKRELRAESSDVVHTLHVTEKLPHGGGQLFFERKGSTRAAVLDVKPFEANAQVDEQRCANVILVPPASPETANQRYVLLRCQGIRPTVDAGRSRHLQVHCLDGRTNVVFLGDTASPSYVRVEERHILRLPNSSPEVHVVHAEEYGSTVTLKSNPVRVELHQPCHPTDAGERRRLWSAFVEMAVTLAAALGKLSSPQPTHHPSDSVSIAACMGDTAIAPCSNPHCELLHRYTICVADACQRCEEQTCKFWHGASEVKGILATLGTALQLANFSFEAITKVAPPPLLVRLRVALSLQLLRIWDAATKWWGSQDRERLLNEPAPFTLSHVEELVKQYNSVAHGFQGRLQHSKHFFERCCLRMKCPLPILALRDTLRDACRSERKYVLVSSSTGSGKSTQIPQYLAEFAAEECGETERPRLVICVEPRALAAASLAEHVAGEYYYHYGPHRSRVQALAAFHESLDKSCRIVYTTEHRMLSLIQRRSIDFNSDVYAVVLDEAHERTIAGDVLLGILRQEAQKPGADFRVVICSATLQMSAYEEYLPTATRIAVAGRAFPVEIVYAGKQDALRPEANYVEETVDAVVSVLVDPISLPDSSESTQHIQGHILAFLPSAVDVEAAFVLLSRRVRKERERAASVGMAGEERNVKWEDLRIHTISGRQSAAEQRGAFAEVERGVQKIILASPIAETAVTINGVSYVIDCGLTRVSEYDPVRHLTKMVVTAVTQSSATQRAGRAGRTGPGVCVRLYTPACFNLLAKDKLPAVKAAPLHRVTLQLAQLGYSMRGFDWIERPSAEAVEATLYELMLHGALKTQQSNPTLDGAGETLVLKAFGRFLLRLDGVSVPLGKMLFTAGTSSDREWLAVCALGAAVMEHFPFLFVVSESEKKKLHAQMRCWGTKYGASSDGDVLCAMRLLVTELQTPQSVVDDQAGTPQVAFLRQRALNAIRRTQTDLFRNALRALKQPGEESETNAVPTVNTATLDEYAGQLRRLFATCYCLQVVTHRGDEEMLYRTVDARKCDCLLTNKSFLKQQHALPQPETEHTLGGARERFDPHGLPDVCVFGSLLFHSTTAPGMLSLCTPVELDWLPPAVRIQVEEAQKAQSVVRTMDLASVLYQGWHPAEVRRWVAKELHGVDCIIAIDYETHQLAIRCERKHIEDVSFALRRAADYAHTCLQQACYEAALNGFCRVTWKRGAELGEILRDRDEYVTLSFSGSYESSICCLSLDVPRMVDHWSAQWFGAPMPVVVRSGGGGVSTAGGQWTALVTFTDSGSARRFFEQFQKASVAERPFVSIEPYSEQQPLAPSAHSAQPSCQISVRLYFGCVDPEGASGADMGAFDFPFTLLQEFEQEVSASLPKGATIASKDVDHAQRQLRLRIIAVNELAADAAMQVLHQIRGPLCHYRSLFFESAYSVELPLPPLANKAFQLLLQHLVLKRPQDPHGQTENSVRCTLHKTIRGRSLMLTCTSAAALQRAIRVVQEATVVKELRLDAGGEVESRNRARALAFQARRLIGDFNKANRQSEECHECQLQLREADGKLCFLGTEAMFKELQSFVNSAHHLNRVACTTLTLPPTFKVARQCRILIDELVADCRVNKQPVRVIWNQKTVTLLAPPAVVSRAVRDVRVSALWRAVDGHENEQFSEAAKARHPQRDRSAVGASEDSDESNECGICQCPLLPGSIRLLCGHSFCAGCLTGLFQAEGAATPKLPITCVTCNEPLSAAELPLFSPMVGLRRVGEELRRVALDKAESSKVELKPCPNRLCLGVPKVVTYSNRLCSGCSLAYCETCSANGVLQSWHDGKHRTPSNALVEKLIQDLPLLPSCPQCHEPFYDFDGCFAIYCSSRHGFCGFCMQDCGADAHSHVAQCKRNPTGSYFGRIELFYQCRVEDLAARMKEVLVSHPAGSLQLAEALFDEVENKMSDDWPRDPLMAVKEELMKHKWPANVAISSRTTAPDPDNDCRGVASQIAPVGDSHVKAARRSMALLNGWPSSKHWSLDDSVYNKKNLIQAIILLERCCPVQLHRFVGPAVESVTSAAEAAVHLFAFYDPDGLVETTLRSCGARCYSDPETGPFLHILLQGIQRLLTKGRERAIRTANLSDQQFAGYRVGSTVVWETPTCCRPEQGSEQLMMGANNTLFRITCRSYAHCRLQQLADTAQRFVLPAGSRMRVVEVVGRVIHVEQETDFRPAT